ncbi:MAG TPA: FG-GAP-like repeat-containing protein [Pyrinomonadaceae bacterium]|jgi:tetratricopeptide (TPR) repeat protein
MKDFAHSLALLLIAALLLASTPPALKDAAAHLQTQASSFQTREQAYRANNIGVALLEQFKYKEGAESFRRALQLEPKLALARMNLAIALFNVPDVAGAQREAQAAMTLAPDAPQPHYLLGLIAKTQNRTDDAIAAFQRVLKIDASDVGANVNLGQLYMQQRKFAEAVVAFRAALAVEPYNGTALYNLGTALLRANQREEGQRVIAQFQELRQRGSGTTLGQSYLEQGRYAEAVASTGMEPELVDRSTPSVAFTDATRTILSDSNINTREAATVTPVFGRSFKGRESGDVLRREIAEALGGSLTLFDMDGDADLDLFTATASGQRLYRNDGGKLSEITSQSGALASKLTGTPTGAVAGDYDNDGKPDLFVIRDGGLALYHNDGGGRFSDVTSASALPAYPYLSSSVAFLDADHDGDLDVFIAGLADLSKAPRGEAVFPEDFAGAACMLLRNDGNGKFTDTTAAAKLDTVGHWAAVVPTDFNNRRDIDLLVLDYGKAPALYSNQRDGTFRNVASDVGLSASGRWTSAAAGDVNKDGYTDFFFGRSDGAGLFAASDGRERFKTQAAPDATAAANGAQFLDYDNDGLLDCLVMTDKGLRVARNVGDGWTDVTARAVASSTAGAQPGGGGGRLFAAGDIETDGDTDIVALSSSGELSIARNDGGNSNQSLRVNLTGKVSNRSGVGAKIEARAGSLMQKLETYSASPAPAPADVLFGLGKRSNADAVRVLWPAGIVQAETEMPTAPSASAAGKAPVLRVTELDRKPSSCPYLYAWNGERFEFITDFMGAGEMGYLEAPGLYNHPDPDEYVRIRGDQLKERDGRFELRVTNELEEALFLDRLQLIAVAHPAGVEVYPNEGMTSPPRPFILYKTKDARPPLAATDEHGHDMLSRITSMDRKYPDDFRRDALRGYAEEHWLTLKLDERAASGRVLLLLTGWTDYSWSSDNLAASQAGKQAQLPALQVKDARGQWRTVIEDIGIPVGRPQTVTVDLTGKFLSPSREVRIKTNMRILWDQILVDTSGGDYPAVLTRLDPAGADLRWRGFSREVTPDGLEPFGYDYERVSFTSPWKVMPGRYTREGDVRELLLGSDDMFVISRPGDSLSLWFDARKLSPLPVGWTRTFLLYSDGYSKEMDINSAIPDQISPLPFHGMTKYPYAAPEAYPMTEVRRAYMERYNTRLVRSELPSVDAVLIYTRDYAARR